MKRFAGLLFTALLAFAPAVAAASVTTTGAGKVPAGGGGGGYIGPGDIVSGAKAWYGLRAYSAAIAATGTQKAAHIIRASDGQSCDVLIATSGDLGNVANCSGSGSGAASAFCASDTCAIDLWYDQSSGGGFTASDGASAKQPTLVFNCLGTKPCAVFAGAQMLATAITSTSQPLTVSAMAIRTGTFTSQNDILATGTGGVYFPSTTANLVGGGLGASFSAAQTDNVWHAIQIAANGASPNSQVNVDGTATNVSAGVSALASSPFIGSQSSVPTSPLTGKLTEVGLWPVAFTSAQQTNVCHNQSTYFGTSASC